MSSLVSRFAENAFWVARYVERAENVARILEVNATFARDDAGDADWRRILDLYAEGETFDASYETADAASVTYFYTLDPDSPSSIVSALKNARENARAIRHLISTEMWTQLNVLYNEIRAFTRRDLRSTNLSNMLARVILGCQTFEGVAEGTFLRSEAWMFYQLGKHIERADQTTRVLDMGYARLHPKLGDAVGAVYWNALLRSVAGFHAFRNRHPMESEPADIARFLLYDHEFPRAAALCLDRITSRLRALEVLHGVRRREAVEAARRELEFTLETGLDEELTPEGLHVFLDRLQVALGRMSNALRETYFS